MINLDYKDNLWELTEMVESHKDTEVSSLDPKNGWVVLRMSDEYIKPWGIQVVDRSFDIISVFEDRWDTYYLENDTGYSWEFNKKDIVWRPRFYILNKECFHCEKLAPYHDAITAKWKHYVWTSQEREFEFDFCSQSCLSAYSKQENFIVSK